MTQLVDLYFHLLALWTPPPLMPLVRDAHRTARLSTGHPIRRSEAQASAVVIPFALRR